MVRWVRRDFDARYRRSRLNSLWAVIQPFAVIGVYFFVFGVIFEQSGGDVPYLSYFLAGMVVFRLVASSLALNACLADNHQLISHSYFPREIVPISQSLGASLELLVTTPALIVIPLVQGVELTPKIVLIPLVYASVLLFSCAICIIASTIQVFVRDLQFVILFASQAIFFGTPISYQADQAPGWLQGLNAFNPVAANIEALRAVTLRGEWPDWPHFLAHLVVGAALLAAAIAHLRAVEHRIVDLA